MRVHLKGLHRVEIATAAPAHARDITEHDARRIAATAGEMGPSRQSPELTVGRKQLI